MKMFSHSRRAVIFAAGSVAAALVYRPRSLAVDADWAGPAYPTVGDYLVAGNWSGGVVPDGMASINGNYLVTLGNTNAASASVQTLQLDGGASFNVSLPTASYSANNYVHVGNTAAATVNLSSGTITIGQWLTVASPSTNASVLNVSGGYLSVHGHSIDVGFDEFNAFGGRGIVNQAGGIVEFDQFLWVGVGGQIGATYFGTARYNLSGGILTALGEDNGSEVIGGGDAVFTHTGGVNTASQIFVGTSPAAGPSGGTGSASYTLSGTGVVSTGFLLVGTDSTFVQSGSSTVNIDLYNGSTSTSGLAVSGTSGARYTLNSGTLNVAAGTGSVNSGTIYVGADGEKGLLEINGGTAGADFLKVATLYGNAPAPGGGVFADSSGTVTLSGATLTVRNDEIIGEHAGTSGSGVVIQTSGSHSVGGSLEIELGGSFFLSGGTLSAGTMLARSGLAVVTGGTASIGVLELGDSGSGVPGTLAISGGSVSVGTSVLGAYSRIIFSNGASISIGGGEYAGTVSGYGSINKTGSATLILSGSNTLSGPINIQGGVLSIHDDWNLGAATAVVRIGAGALLFTNDITTSRTVEVRDASSAIAVSSDMLVAAMSGVISGTGALTSSGPGTLVLSGTNTYTGPTTISGGVLSVSSDVNIGSSGGAIKLGNATLLATGTFTSGRPVALNNANATIDVSGTNSLTLTGTLTGANLTKGTGSGTLVLGTTNAISLTSLNVLGGRTYLGNPSTTNGIAHALNIETLTITNNATVAIAQTGVFSGTPSPSATYPTRLIHTIGTLNIAYNDNGLSTILNYSQGSDTSSDLFTYQYNVAPPSATGTLDINNHAVIFNTPNNAAATKIEALVMAGYNASSYGNIDGTWTGRGITSSVAKNGTFAGQYKYDVGIVSTFDRSMTSGNLLANLTNSSLAQNLGTNQTLVATILLGDINFDGTVDGNDFALLIGTPGVLTGLEVRGRTGDGDINHDGVVDGSDYAMLLGSININSGETFSAASLYLLAAPPPVAASQSTPEPAGLSVAALAAAGLLRRQRRKRTR